MIGDEGYGWSALEYDDFDGPQWWSFFRDALREEGLIPGVWFTNGDNLWNVPLDASFVVAEIEGSQDLAGVLRYRHYVPEGMDKAILTNFGGMPYDTEENLAMTRQVVRPLIEEGWKCLTEVYRAKEDGTPLSWVTPESMDNIASKLGWDGSQPCFGFFGGLSREDYAQFEDWSNGWSGWSAERR